MFTTDSFVDLVQTAKKDFVEKTIDNREVKQILNTFIDAQTSYTLAAVRSFTKVGTDLTALTYDRDFLKNAHKIVKLPKLKEAA